MFAEPGIREGQTPGATEIVRPGETRPVTAGIGRRAALAPCRWLSGLARFVTIS
jgi:hypothetical protein